MINALNLIFCFTGAIIPIGVKPLSSLYIWLEKWRRFMGSNTIMIVDDEKRVLRVIEKVLKKEGYDIHCVTSATHALDSIEEIKPQVILSDRRIPQMEGLDLLIRVKERHPECYCVLMTGYPYIPESVQHALQKGNIDLVIKKPIDYDAFIAKIKDAFKDRQYGSSL